MPSNFQRFKSQLDEAIELIGQNSSVAQGSSLANIMSLSANLADLVDTKSLLSRCNSICEQHERKKPVIRVVHHLACSGGTLISKCISAMPNVYLLSEVHPYTDLAIGKDKPKYAPSDIASLTKYAGIPNQKQLAGILFKNAIDQVYKHVQGQGGTLVLREHTHADFNTHESIPEKGSVLSLLEEDYEVRSILTFRDPIDSYSSLVKNGWVNFEPSNFDEYCRRLLLLLEQFKPNQIFKYEDFLKAPQQQMRLMTSALELPFSELFEDVFGMFKVTGDSGRTSDVINGRTRIAPVEILQESECSEHYLALKNSSYTKLLNV
ncbi:hypothetical protein [Thalassotalea euphylliae]|uniref:Sulfotransferase family protein n=1 Tax=Thalassotalea euphylliae TaxID=1655234 RepID=A0A3E0TZW3_9GAMM|nr:hypothetical protein [Thalassotalea euphylliae]REL30198.1 hypothetical protein DXX94_05480 [Thalassotalea euphylliae]